MELLGVGLSELLFIGLILLLVLGPTELISLGRKSGRLIRRMRQSDTWLMVANLAQALRNLPNALADEARTEEIFGNVVPKKDRRTIAPPETEHNHPRPRPDSSGRESGSGFSAWTTPPSAQSPQSGRSVTEPELEESPDPDPTGTGRR
jgi:Sec-independent protein translocase protein TatA